MADKQINELDSLTTGIPTETFFAIEHSQLDCTAKISMVGISDYMSEYLKNQLNEILGYVLSEEKKEIDDCIAKLGEIKINFKDNINNCFTTQIEDAIKFKEYPDYIDPNSFKIQIQETVLSTITTEQVKQYKKDSVPIDIFPTDGYSGMRNATITVEDAPAEPIKVEVYWYSSAAVAKKLVGFLDQNQKTIVLQPSQTYHYKLLSRKGKNVSITGTTGTVKGGHGCSMSGYFMVKEECTATFAAINGSVYLYLSETLPNNSEVYPWAEHNGQTVVTGHFVRQNDEASGTELSIDDQENGTKFAIFAIGGTDGHSSGTPGVYNGGNIVKHENSLLESYSYCVADFRSTSDDEVCNTAYGKIYT